MIRKMIIPITRWDHCVYRQVMDIPLSTYRCTRSVMDRVDRLESVLRVETALTSEEIDRVVSACMPSLVPPGTKGAVRGRVFEGIVRDVIMGLSLSNDEFSIMFGDRRMNATYEAHGITEVPDFVIRGSQKTMYGMVQMDLWKGGAQLNRGMKYILHKDHPDTKLLCVVCAPQPPSSASSKIHKMLRYAVEHNRVCHVSGLGQIINDYFCLHKNHVPKHPCMDQDRNHS